MTTVQFPVYSGHPPREKPGQGSLPEREAGHRRYGMNDIDTVGGYAVPVDPMDDLQCESCQ